MPNLMPLSTLAALSVHPFADEFPYLSDDETLELAQDIEAHGLLHPVVLFENEILDGRNRLRALAKTNLVSVPVEEYLGDDPIGYIVSLNLARRHLTTGQRAALAVSALPYYEAAAETRMKAGVQSAQSYPTLNSAEGSKGESAELVAEKFGVGKDSVKKAKALSLNATDLFAEMKQGTRSVNDAYSELQRRQGKHATPGDKTRPEPKPEYGVTTGADTSWGREDAPYEQKRIVAAEVFARGAKAMLSQIDRFELGDDDITELSAFEARRLADFFTDLAVTLEAE